MANRRVRKETLETARGLYELGALKQLPADVVVHPKLVVTRKSGEAILKQTRTGKPTKALRDLMRDGEVFVSKVGDKVVLSAERLSWDDFLDAKHQGCAGRPRPPQRPAAAEAEVFRVKRYMLDTEISSYFFPRPSRWAPSV